MTIGKRIATGRKALGLTQDQLAEKIGVTAQAVSKWENDQSCPDISTLPKLADILHTSTDALLGRMETTHTTPPPAPDQAPPTRHHPRRSWDLRLALLVLLIGLITMTAAILGNSLSFWSILWPSLIMIVGISGSWRSVSFFHLGCLFLGLWYLLQNTGLLASPLDNALILPCILILFGISLLLDTILRQKKPNRSPSKNDFTAYEDHLSFNASFGEDRRTPIMSQLTSGEISVSFGDYQLDFSSIEQIDPNCTLTASCSFGELRLLIPSRYQVQCDGSSAFASIETIGHPDPAPVSTIDLQANCSFGQITINYI